MSILYNGGSDPSKVYYNSVDLSKVYYNGELVWESYRETVVEDYENDIPTGIKTNPTNPSFPEHDMLVYSPVGFGDNTQATLGNIEPVMNQYEVGYYLDNGTPAIYSVGSFIANRRPATEINITNYNTCLVEAYSYNANYSDSQGPIQFMPWGSIGAHQFGMFTMLNNTELRALCGNWTAQQGGGYWWDQENLYPNNYVGQSNDHSIPYADYNPLVSADPTPDWWSEVPWNLKLGFAFHTWYRNENGYKYAGAAGPVWFTKQNFATYGQAVKFSIKNLTGTRPLRCIMLPFSTTGTHTTGGSEPTEPAGVSGGGIYISKITLNTNKCEQ